MAAKNNILNKIIFHTNKVVIYKQIIIQLSILIVSLNSNAYESGRSGNVRDITPDLVCKASYFREQGFCERYSFYKDYINSKLKGLNEDPFFYTIFNAGLIATKKEIPFHVAKASFLLREDLVKVQYSFTFP